MMIIVPKNEFVVGHRPDWRPYLTTEHTLTGAELQEYGGILEN